MRVDAIVVRNLLLDADLSGNRMTERIAVAMIASRATVYRNLRDQGTSVRQLLRQERRRRLDVWIAGERAGGLNELRKILGFAHKKETAAFLERETGLKFNQWQDINDARFEEVVE